MINENNLHCEETLCTCCPYGYHIHVDFVKFAEEQLSCNKENTISTSRRSSVVSVKSKIFQEDQEDKAKPSLSLIFKPVKREGILIQEKIRNLLINTPKSAEDLYGPDLLRAIKQFDDFVTKAWGKGQPSKTDMMKEIEAFAYSISDRPTSSSIGVNTELEEFSFQKPDCSGRCEQLSKLTIHTQKSFLQKPDCGGEGTAQNLDSVWGKPDFHQTSELGIGDFENSLLKDSDEKLEPETSIPKTPTSKMISALQTVNQALLHGKASRATTTSINVAMREWFETVSKQDSRVEDVLNYLKTFQDLSPQLFRYMVNIPDMNGITALHYAVSYANYPVISALLDTNSVDIDKPNKSGYTSILLASLAEITTPYQESVVRKLLGLGDVNVRAAQHGQTALMLAASHGRFKMLKLLLEAGAEINAQDEDGSTALMCAAEHGHADVVQALLACPGCDHSIKDNDGLTALKVAMDANHKDIAVLLYAHMHFDAERPPTETTILLSRRSKSTVSPLGSPRIDDSEKELIVISSVRKQRSSIN